MRIKNLLFGGSDAGTPVANLGLALLRVAVGLTLAFAHGIGKIPPSERFIEGVAALGFPLPGIFAWAAGAAEFFCALLLAVGLLTRPSAFFVLFTMGVAFFIRHGADPFKRKELAFLYGLLALAFLLIGAGRYSIDALIRSRSSRRNP